MGDKKQTLYSETGCQDLRQIGFCFARPDFVLFHFQCDLGKSLRSLSSNNDAHHQYHQLPQLCSLLFDFCKMKSRHERHSCGLFVSYIYCPSSHSTLCVLFLFFPNLIRTYLIFSTLQDSSVRSFCRAWHAERQCQISRYTRHKQMSVTLPDQPCLSNA